MFSSLLDDHDRRGLIISLVLLVLLVALALSSRPYIPIDETRYVGVAWEMWLRGDFLVPFKNGEPYSHKPPFMFWMFQAGWGLFGVNEWWPRLVSPLFAAGALWLTYALGRRLWPQTPGVGGRAALILVSSLLWIVFSTSAMFDVLLAFWVLLGMHGVLSAAEGKRRGFVFIGVAIGLGVLTKGPVVLLNILPVAALAPWWNPGLRWGRWFGSLLIAVLIGAAIALAWAIPAGFTGGEAYRNAIFWGQTAGRMVDSFAHRRPFWWYVPLLPLMFFPWFVWPGLWKSITRHVRTGLDRGSRFCLAWMLPVFVAFSFISGKQPHYLVPLFPAFALFAARALADRPSSRLAVPALLVALLGAALVLAGSGQFAALRDRVAVLPLIWPGAALAGLALIVWLAARRANSGVPGLSLLGVATFGLLLWTVSPSITPLYDIKPMAQAIRHVQDSGRQVANTARYHNQYQFLGRLNSPLVELRGDKLMPWLNAHPDDYAVVYLDHPEDARGIKTEFAQPYRGGAAVLVDTRTATALLAARAR